MRVAHSTSTLILTSLLIHHPLPLTLGHVSAIFFFKDPLSAHQHAADIEALTRICDVHNVAYATNSASGKSLVTVMAFLGLGFESSEESVTVKEYKAEQAQVIRRLSVIS